MPAAPLLHLQMGGFGRRVNIRLTPWLSSSSLRVTYSNPKDRQNESGKVRAIGIAEMRQHSKGAIRESLVVSSYCCTFKVAYRWKAALVVNSLQFLDVLFTLISLA